MCRNQMSMTRKIKSPQKNITKYLIITLLIAILAILALESATSLSKEDGGAQTTEAYAQEVLSRCAKSTYRPRCYDEEIPKLSKFLSMEEAFQVTRIVQQEDPSYFYCHVLGHELSALETREKPEAWKDVVARCPSGICSNGCIHGAFQERFRLESLSEEQTRTLITELEGICEERPRWNPTGLEQASCYHALGHLLMYATEADTTKATQLCRQLAIEGERDFSHLCYDGVFMQIFQPLEAEDFALVEGKTPQKEEVRDFCKDFSGKARNACWTESWALVRQEILNPEGVVNFCLKGLSSEPNRCFDSMFYIAAAQFGLDEGKIKDYCSSLPQMYQGQCFANASVRMIQTDWRLTARAVGLCSSALQVEEGAGETCFEKLLLHSDFTFPPASQEFFRLCQALPEGWQADCLRRVPKP